MILISTYITALVAVWLRQGVLSWLLPLVWGGSTTTWMSRLAAISADENQVIVWVIVGLAFVASVAANIRLAFFNKEQPSPQPFLIKLEEAFVKKEDFDAFKIDVHNQLRDMRAYIHDEIHGVKDSQNAAVIQAREAFETLRELIASEFKELDRKRSVSIAGLHENLNGVRDRVSATEQLADSLNQGLHAANTRIDAIRNRPRG